MNSNPALVSTQQLNRWVQEDAGLVLIDVSLEEYYAAAHLPAAKNACVYRVDFLETVGKLVSDLHQKIVVYGSSAKSLASSVAKSKLAAAGFNNVFDFNGGIEEWCESGHRIEGTGLSFEPPAPQEKTYRVDVEQSFIEWTGRNIAGKRTGTLKLSAGEITIKNASVAAGSFEIDIQSMVNTDIEDRSMATVLIHHLVSEDFFEVAKYPNGKFVISSIAPISDTTPGRPNFKVHGTLTLKGIQHAIEFPAQIGLQANGSIVAQANFEIDRTDWNIIYGSGKFFENLGMHLVNDLVGIQLKIVVE